MSTTLLEDWEGVYLTKMCGRDTGKGRLAYQITCNWGGELHVQLTEAQMAALVSAYDGERPKLKITTEWLGDGHFNLFCGDTFLGRYDQNTVTPLANALTEALKR